MNENLSMKFLSNFCCSSCRAPFYVKDLTFKGSRCPMLLHCGHSICNSCLQQNSKGSANIICQLCGYVSTVKSAVLSKCFSFNMYILGSLLAFQNSRLEKDKKLAFLRENNGEFNYGVLGQSNDPSKPDSHFSVCEECSLKATWHCENCKSNFCDHCWSRVHGSAKSLTKHFRTAISEVSRNYFKKCSEHETQNLEFFCKDCSKTICSHCVILQHQGEGHHSITLKEKNLEIYNKVKMAVGDAEKMGKRMKQTLREIKLKQMARETPESKVCLDFVSEIMRNFSHIHGFIQLMEERLLKKIQDKLNERDDCFKALQTQLEKQMEDVEHLLRECESAMKQPQQSDLTEFYQKLIEVQNTPCYLITKKTGNEEAKLKFNESVLTSLLFYCTMELPSDESFELCSSSNLPEGYAIDPLDVSDQEESQGVESKVSSVQDLDTLSNGSLRDLRKEGCESQFPKEIKVFFEKKSYTVRVSFIKSPGEFYVTLNSQRMKQRAIDRRASTMARLTSVIPQTYGKDDIFLVKYNVDKKWYRGRVMEVIPTKREGGEDQVLVYYLDYGNFETVPISRLRPIPPDLLEESPLAIKCKLFDCVPQNDEWCEESTKTMEKILKSQTATMFVMKVHSDCLEVDLSVIYPEGQIGRDLVSVRDALLFLGFSSFVHGFKVPRVATAFKYLDQCPLPVGETFDVTISHVNSPSDFYIQRTILEAPYLYKLSVDLQTYYEETLEKGIIYNPTVDMPCAALFSSDKRWYRAKIVDVPGKKMVTVFYVDFGNKETIPWTEIRKLKESFAKSPPMAYNCALAGILPGDGSPWSTQAVTYLERQLLMREGRVVIQSISKSKQKYKVLLFKKLNKREVCLNTSFVDLGFANKNTDLDVWPSNIQDKDDDSFLRKDETEKMETATSENKEMTILKNHTFKERKRCKPTAKELRELHESEKKHADERPSNEHVGNEIDQYKNIFKVKVDILSAESPSCIYVTFPTLMEEFDNLQVKLNEFYQNSTGSLKDLAVGSICVVFDSKKGCWYRASVTSLLPNDQVQVFLKDIARTITEPVSSLRELDPVFKKYSTCAIKCHLADVKPPGEEWPSISCEFLSDELDNHKEVYMTKRGTTACGSLPVELWVQKILSRGALEPIKKEWVTLNRLLVSQGLAVPAKLEMWSGLEMSTEDERSDEEKSMNDTHEESTVASSDNMNETNSSDTFVPSINSSWLPSLPIEKSRFLGMPTYVDFNAFIYMYDIQEEENLKKIREALLKEYRHSRPIPEDHFWIPGQMCIARYHADNFWYRGLVLQQNEDMNYDVLFVDYGNVETCQVSDLRKRIKMHDIPILNHKFLLRGIKTSSENGKWPEFAIDILHSVIVDRKCEVEIVKRPEDPEEPYTINLRVVEGDIDVGMLLVEKNLAVFDFPFCSTPSESCDEFEELQYVPLVIPDNCHEFFIEVTQMISETEFFANIVNEESVPSNMKKILDEFQSLQLKLKEEGHSQPTLENLTEGQPCCCLDFANNKWCRGKIETLTKNKKSVYVCFVDYGIKEALHKDFIRECNSSWLKLPVMAIKFKLGGVEKCPDVSQTTYMAVLDSCLNKSVLFAEILKKHEDFIEVRLLDDKNGPLAYQEMIDEGLMKVIST